MARVPDHPAAGQTSSPAPQQEWFAEPNPRPSQAEPGLRFGCTQCGNCCSGPPGYVLISDAEAKAFATHLSIPLDDFLRDYTRILPEGRSLIERHTEHGFDCVFLDRATIPGKAICGAYNARPAQCRTWPFWPSLVKSPVAWERAKHTCPGIDKGTHYTPVQIRIQRDSFRI